MKPAPRPRHFLAVLILASVAAAAGYIAMRSENLSGTQKHMGAVAVKRHDPDLYPHDPIFGESGFWRFHTWTFQGPMELVLIPTGYHDVTLPFRLAAGPLMLLYLLGMYALLWRQCRSWSVAAFVSVLSATVIYTPGRAFWGIGSLGSIIPSAAFTAVIPLIMLAYLRYESHPLRLHLVFLVVGLLGNLHLVTAMNLTGAMLVAYLGKRRFAPKALSVAMGCAAAALLGAAPYAAYFLALGRQYAPPGGAAPAAWAMYRALEMTDLAAFYPEMFKSLLYWLPWAGVLGLPTAAVLARVERFRVRDAGTWSWFLIGSAGISLVLTAFVQLVAHLRGEAPMIVDFVRASKLVMLPLYALFAQALVNLFRMVREHRYAIRAACALVLAAWVIPSDNFRWVRHRLYDTATVFAAESEKPLRVQELHARAHARAERQAIADWAREQTDPAAVFVTDRIGFRTRSRRAIVGGPDDARYLYYLAPHRLEEWVKLMDRQMRLLHPPTGQADPEAIVQFVSDLAASKPYTGVPAWYVLLETTAAPPAPLGLEPVSGAGWGSHYELYRVGPP